jgi:two-component system NtrC family sensor kinase
MFTLRFPAAPATDDEPDRGDATEGRHVVLLVDDNADVRDAVGAQLQQLGAEVVTVGTVAAAQNAVAARRDFTLILSDYDLASAATGLHLAQWVRDRSLGIPVVICSGHTEVPTEEIAARGLRHLTKPVSLAELRTLLREIAGSP